MSDEQAQKLGEQLIEVLQLKVKSNGRVDTSWGDKTPIGLGKTVEQIVKDSTQ